LAAEVCQFQRTSGLQQIIDGSNQQPFSSLGVFVLHVDLILTNNHRAGSEINERIRITVAKLQEHEHDASDTLTSAVPCSSDPSALKHARGSEFSEGVKGMSSHGHTLRQVSQRSESSDGSQDKPIVVELSFYWLIRQDIPVTDSSLVQALRTGDRGLGFAVVSEQRIQLWGRTAISSHVVRGVLQRISGV